MAALLVPETGQHTISLVGRKSVEGC